MRDKAPGLRRLAKVILPADPFVAAAVERARKGDQVRFKGWLVSYGQTGAPHL